MNNFQIFLLVYFTVAITFSWYLSIKNWRTYLTSKTKDDEVTSLYIESIEKSKKTRYIMYFLLIVTMTVFFPLVVIDEAIKYIKKGNKK